ncbi:MULTISPECIES: substrate-binding periplasmic protein [unclassified Shinella]|jgi:polar amino acid transport system substrate-binding protein|uniref:substrate-binding periplasmic protein n=2 Tax=Shinella TaxID=323620 RepID=UPI0003C55C80|nr:MULTISPECIES: transporter substrate-binding domain-containing protein [unclassified Shinella]MCA0345162.1 transporter substrate-binding domain-containing protein [Pseudomonadota bacterium]EYR81268.1 putative amino acid ABC transporter [Shinella sp. DD12]MCO5151906.1 transporter substrate-binding domain-containing protein [Shinella sp.]MDC7265508.1 transporter substrate-binding domain-containing protein [Shinella sp. HY16]MDC7272405.1 transporter substrate-binding domain-containing protein [
MLRRALLALVLGVALPGGAFARCEDYKPQPKPQNTFAQDVGRDFDRILEEGWIEFAVYADYAPWSYEEKGKAVGVDVEIGRLIAKGLGVEAKFRLVAAGENLEADLLNYVWKGATVGGRVSDVMLHVPYDSALVCRIEQVTFTGQYATESIAIAYRAADYAEKGPTPPFFRFDPVAVENDSIADFYLTSLIGPVDKIHRYRSVAAAMDGLAEGVTKAAMGPRAELEAGLVRHPESGLTVHAPPLVGFARGSWTVGIGINFQHKDLAYAVDEAIAAALADGEIARIFAAHGLTFTPPTR